MATGYWDYDGTGTTTGDLGDNWTVDSTQGTTTSGSYTWTNTATTSTRYIVRRVIVKHPEHWDKQKTADYVKLVNKETNTGWKIDMVFEGDVAIVDPDVEIREMDEFAILLKHRASQEDCEKIDKFFKEAGIK